MGKYKIPIIIAAVIIVILMILGGIHNAIEARLFNGLASGYDPRVSIQRRTGNLFNGYDLTGVEISQSRKVGDRIPFVLVTPQLSIHWRLLQKKLTEISWTEGTYTISNDESEDVIEFGEGSLTPNGTGWIASEDPIRIGPESWDGWMELKFRQNGQEVDGRLDIERFPSRLMYAYGDVREGVILPVYLEVHITVSGRPPDIHTDTTFIDPLTNRSYSFFE